MYEKTRQDSRMLFYVTAGVLFVVTIVLFIVYFFLNEDMLLAERDQQEDLPVMSVVDDVGDPELQAQITQLEAERTVLQSELASQYLMLVDAQNMLPEDYAPSGLVEVASNPAMELEAMAELMLGRFIAAAREAGYVPILLHCYLDEKEQQALFDATVQDYMNAGFTRSDAEVKASMDVARPYASDHMTGLSVDIADKTKPTEFVEYAKQHMHEYGFVLSYLEGKENVTGMNHSDQHFRYVGDSARAIYEKGMTLSEYRFYLNQQIQLKTEQINALTKKMGNET